MGRARVIVIVIDACGVGELPDAAGYGDSGAATLPHVADAAGGLAMPVCQRLGLGNIVPITGVPPVAEPLAAFGMMAERSAGKDSTSGHWEIGGLVLEKPFPLFPEGFPEEIVRQFEREAGVKTMGNKPASGTEIIKELGERHLRTKEVILYTSADSVFQLAAHEDIYPVDELYRMCRTARRLLGGEYAVARVIARPFKGTPGDFVRTTGRKDFSLEPQGETILDLMLKNGYRNLAVGKTYDLFSERGFTAKVEAKNNAEVMSAVRKAAANDREHQLVFANCVDFDMLWGHRNDFDGFAAGLEEFDRDLGELLPLLRPEDMLIITADHGCDPTMKESTDHTREYVPLLVLGTGLKRAIDLGTRETFSDIACTVAEFFGLPHSFKGRSFLDRVSS